MSSETSNRRSEPHAQQASYTDERGRQVCWITGCFRRSVFTDWGGAHWCWRHVWRYAQRPLRWAYFPPKVKS